MKIRRIICFSFLLVLVMDVKAHAYIDPSGGGMLFQVLAPMFILLSVLGLYFKRALMSACRRMIGRQPDEKEKDKEPGA